MCGVFGANVTSAVVAELGHEPDRAQTLLLPMVVTIVMDRQKKRQTVRWQIAKVKYWKQNLELVLMFYSYGLYTKTRKHSVHKYIQAVYQSVNKSDGGTELDLWSRHTFRVDLIK